MSAYANGYGKFNQAGPSSLDLLKKRIKDDQLNGVYMFWGVEEYTKDFYAEKIRKIAKSSPLPEFNYIVMDGSKQSPGDLEEAVEALPYMWEHKVIEIRDLNPARMSVSDAEAYASIFSDLPDYASVLILFRADDYDGSAKSGKSEKEGTEKKNGFSVFQKAVEENGLVVEFESEKGDKLVSWITRHFTAQKVQTEPNLPSALISYCGSDMYTLQGEIQKLCDIYSGTPLTEADVKKYCCANESYVFFDVATCLNRKDIAGARKILSGLRLNAETIPMSMGYLASNYQLMLLVKTGTESGKSINQIANEQKIPSWKVSKAATSVLQVDAAQLRYAVQQIAEADDRIKNRRGNPAATLEFLIYRICAYGK